MSERDREAFETRLLEDRRLFDAVRETEAAFLSDGARSRIGSTCAACFVAGALAGVAIVALVQRFCV
jgi:hypothetical protein